MSWKGGFLRVCKTVWLGLDCLSYELFFCIWRLFAVYFLKKAVVCGCDWIGFGMTNVRMYIEK